MQHYLQKMMARFLGVVLLSTCPWGWAADSSQYVEFRQGQSVTELRGKITGGDISDYKLIAKKGQQMQIYLKSKRLTTYYNVIGPDGGDVLFNSSISDDNYNDTLLKSGQYIIRVYQMGGVKANNKTTSFTLKVRIY
ncbi:MAG: DNA breaking-rejoining protein [Plesiomonas sp.]|uniref:DNA breaking-rejoining protein n=1 Tax=Plesiomonas sp. TaxID=2486279 RepID=UPI003F31A34A